MSDNKVRYIAEYSKKNCKQICLKLNKVHDAEILERLEQVASKQGYIKALILADIQKGDKDGYWQKNPEWLERDG